MALYEALILGAIFAWAIYIVFRTYWKKKSSCTGCGSDCSSKACDDSITQNQLRD